MEPGWDELFTVDQIMGGLPARRASTLLFAIEGRTAYLVARSRRAMSRDYSGRSAELDELAFLSAISEGASLPLEPSIQDLERYASDWVSLVPDDPSVRAALARLIGEKNRVPARFTPKLQRALYLHDPETVSRFQDLHGEPVSSIFAAELSPRERLRWFRARMAARLESMPPFWLAFSLTLTETVGGGALALPIAFAKLGVAGAVMVLLVLGLVNALTISALAEAMTRNGEMRYGKAYFGRIIEGYLGSVGRYVLTFSVAMQLAVTLLAYVIGISTTLNRAVGWSPMIWAGAVFLFLLFILRNGSIESTVASALVVGFCTVGLLMLLSLLTVPYLNIDYLRHSKIPIVNVSPFDAGVLQLIFGVALLSLTGHVAAANSASAVTPRDHSGRSLILGSSAAIACSAALYIIWIIAVNGAVEPAVLAAESGTALEPLADVAGPAVLLIGTIFVLLAMGMACIYKSWGLANLMREWVPASMLRSGTPENQARKSLLFGMIPTLLVILTAEALFAMESDSFAKPIAIIGTINMPLIVGVFPMLLLYAARRKGDRVPGYLWAFLGNRFVAAGLIFFYLSSIVAHGLFIFSNPALRAVAIAVAIGVALFILYTARTAFFPSGTLEVVYDDQGGISTPAVSLVAAGQTVKPLAMREAERASAVTRHAHWHPSLDITVPAMPITGLRVWVHELVSRGISIPLGATVVADEREFQIEARTGKITIPVTEKPMDLVIQASHDAR